jgi:hypothetical protein
MIPTALVLGAWLASVVPAAAQSDQARMPPVYPWLRLGGFSDFNFFATDTEDTAATSGFREGQFALHFTSALSPRFSFFGEVSLTARDHEFAVEVERTILKFDANDWLGLSFGRYHTPINWWNNAYHHGQWLQTTVARPQMTRFGGVFIPVHFVGALAEGVLPAAGLNVNYKAGLGNGRGAAVSRGGDLHDVNNHRAWLANLYVQPDRLYRLQVGGAVYRDRVRLTAPRSAEETIASAFAVWTKETPEILAEYAFARHTTDGASADFDNHAWYVQVAWRLPWVGGRFKPYGRWERLDIAAADPVFVPSVGDLREYTAGVRAELSDYAAWKGEYRRQETPDAKDSNAFFTQISFAF